MSLPAPDIAEKPGGEVRYEGSAASPGIAIGPVYIFATPEDGADGGSKDLPPDAVQDEIRRFENARSRSMRQLRKIATFAREKLGESSAAIFEAQVMAIGDPAVRDEVRHLIKRDRVAAENAVRTTLEAVQRRMASSSSEYFRDRAGDIVDVQDRIIRNLRQTRAVSTIAPEHIVVAENLTAADLLVFSRRRILAVAIDFGGPTSHVSIMARSLGVPAVVSLHELSGTLKGDETLIVDGFSGRVVVNPTEDTLAEYRERLDLYRRRVERIREERSLPAETRCGTRITLRGNIELEEELPLLRDNGAEGIGLFRTEMLLLARGRPLDEEEQLKVFRSVVRAAAPHPTTFRLLDLGGDKMLPMAHREHNPFLGWRGVRVLLDKPEIVRPQMRAIARVAVEGPVRMLIPMVSSLDDVHRVRQLFREAITSLEEDGLEHRAEVPLGVMVEVPAVALAAERYAAEVDFLSLGTNDLTQFMLAVDRGNDLVSSRYHEVHPAVLRMIKETVLAAAQYNIPVSICGEMAGNPRAAALLIGLGLRELSASPTFLPDLKVTIRSITVTDAESLAEQALQFADSQSVRTLIVQWMNENLPELAAFFNNHTRQIEVS